MEVALTLKNKAKNNLTGNSRCLKIAQQSQKREASQGFIA
jgi:hypothetical protein